MGQIACSIVMRGDPYFVAYDFDTNYIFAIPIKDVKDSTLVANVKKYSIPSEIKDTSLPLISQTTKQFDPSRNT